MNRALFEMLEHYSCKTVQDYVNALKEVLQEAILLGLWRAKFFEHAAFYGGTALRILHGLNRFSEDLDFSLLTPQQNFSISRYSAALEEELSAFGIDATVKEKPKSHETAIQSAFLKANTTKHLLHTNISPSELKQVHLTQQLKIRIEIDTDPPPYFKTEEHFLLQPVPFAVRTFSPPDLFAGKLHALLCRAWKDRVKGRDWWDTVWFIGKGVPVHLKHLEARMQQSGHLKESLTEPLLRQLLAQRVEALDLEQALQDISPFIADRTSLELWSKPFFESVLKRLECI